MADEHIERRTFVGETAVGAFDGFAGFRFGKSYQLHYPFRDDSAIGIAFDYAPIKGWVLVVCKKQFAKW
jgi:hypothetical protein